MYQGSNTFIPIVCSVNSSLANVIHIHVDQYSQLEQCYNVNTRQVYQVSKK